ncbi:MAG: type II toxin-antitoxin system HicB family antitoxin [Butyrivibrio sp.]|nr:type II toxin-antitoxin system HicB family antitoxin [Butyrivibrio sp.]
MDTKRAYPIILKKDDSGYYVVIPDFDIGTQGATVVEAIEMARDAIGLMGIDMQDDGDQLPEPYSRKVEKEEGDIETLVDVDFVEYRKKVDNRAVKKNCTIPYWISVEADKANINYSRILQDALVKQLGLVQNTL